MPGKSRVVSVLSDGLGSGVKANILSSMTASMALRFMEGDTEILRSAEVIMDALPVCRERGISYATFTIVDAVLHGWTRVIEMDNPPFLLVRGGSIVTPGKREMASSRWKDRKITVNEFFARPEDRIILFSDGVTQAGMGSWANPTGWGGEKCADFILRLLRDRPGMSSRELSKRDRFRSADP
ncbi:SpoIIE family protein phosphatase [Aminivibrio sp.]|uniref:SpoIIE family protein phosphatase n=1 Tax=Aminivibrio sp. TaxID=1872489 RepID=UPI003D97798F